MHVSCCTFVLLLAIPHIARYFFEGRKGSPQMVRCPPLVLSFTQAHLCDTPFCKEYRAIIVRYPIKASTKHFCDIIATSIARYEKCRYWASKCAVKMTSMIIRNGKAAQRESFGRDILRTSRRMFGQMSGAFHGRKRAF